MSHHLRTAQLHDAASLAELSGELGYPSGKKSLESRLQQLLQKDDHCVFVALQKDSIIGWVHGFYTLRVESDPFVEIGGLVVSEGYRGQGVGKALVQEVTRWAQQIPCYKVRVRSNVLRTESHGFYEGMGFVKVKEQVVLDFGEFPKPL